MSTTPGSLTGSGSPAPTGPSPGPSSSGSTSNSRPTPSSSLPNGFLPLDAGEDAGVEAFKRWTAVRTAWLTPPPAGPSSPSSPSRPSPASPPSGLPRSSFDNRSSHSSASGSSSKRSSLTDRVRLRVSGVKEKEKAKAPLPVVGLDGLASGGQETRKLDPIERAEQDRVLEELIRDFDRSGARSGPLAVKKNACLKVAKQLTDGKKLAKPIQLQHAVAILYRGWLHDGTIPSEYHPSRRKDDDDDARAGLTDPEQAEFVVPNTRPRGGEGINSRKVPVPVASTASEEG